MSNISVYREKAKERFHIRRAYKERSEGKRYPDPYSPGINIYFTDGVSEICSLKTHLEVVKNPQFVITSHVKLQYILMHRQQQRICLSIKHCAKTRVLNIAVYKWLYRHTEIS